MENLIVLAIFFVIWFVGWIGNLGKAGKKNPPQNPGRPPAQPDKKLQEEIERFLRDVGVKPEEPKKQPPPQPPRPTTQPAAQQKPKPQQRKTPKPAKQKNYAGSAPAMASDSGTPTGYTSLANRTDGLDHQHLATQHLQTQHLGEKIQDQKLNSSIQEYLKRRQSGQSHEDAASSLRAQLSPQEFAMAAKIHSDSTKKSQGRSSQNIIQLFRQPESVRQAVVMSEILKRPRVLDRTYGT